MPRASLLAVLLAPAFAGCEAACDCPPTDTAVPDSGDTAGDSAIDTATADPEGFARISAGTFTMGCTAEQIDCDEDEVVHTVTLTHDYWVGTTEVTQGEFVAKMGYNPSIFADCGLDCPVERLSWDESAAYANAVSSAAGLESCYTCDRPEEAIVCAKASSPYLCEGYRLLTEAEWERAARCDEGFVYAGSDDVLEVGWIVDNSAETTHPVASLKPNACGLYDMSGNVFERTQDNYGPLSPDPVTDPLGPEGNAGSLRAGRGGSWSYTSADARVADRSYGTPDHLTLNVGFRLARTAP